MNFAGTGDIIAKSVVNQKALYEKWKMVKDVIISGKVLILNKETGTIEKQFSGKTIIACVQYLKLKRKP